MDFDYSLNHLFAEVTNLFWARLELSMREIGLHSGQIFVLIYLWQEDGKTQIEVSQSLNLSPPTINKMIKSLENKDFIYTRRSKKDARKVKVFLSERGKEIRENVERQWQKLENDFFSPLNETERLILRQIFDKLKSQLHSKAEEEGTGK